MSKPRPSCECARRTTSGLWKKRRGISSVKPSLAARSRGSIWRKRFDGASNRLGDAILNCLAERPCVSRRFRASDSPGYERRFGVDEISACRRRRGVDRSTTGIEPLYDQHYASRDLSRDHAASFGEASPWHRGCGASDVLRGLRGADPGLRQRSSVALCAHRRRSSTCGASDFRVRCSDCRYRSHRRCGHCNTQRGRLWRLRSGSGKSLGFLISEWERRSSASTWRCHSWLLSSSSIVSSTHGWSSRFATRRRQGISMCEDSDGQPSVRSSGICGAQKLMLMIARY